MRKFVLVALFALGLVAVGCNEAQVKADIQKADSVINKVVTTGVNAIAAVRSVATPENVAKAESAIAMVASTTGPLHQAAVDAQAALDAYKKGQATIDQVDNALAKVQAFTQHVVTLTPDTGN